jgi:hypothetical protein
MSMILRLILNTVKSPAMRTCQLGNYIVSFLIGYRQDFQVPEHDQAAPDIVIQARSAQIKAVLNATKDTPKAPASLPCAQIKRSSSD